MAPKTAKVSGPFSYQAAKQACTLEDMARLACCFLSRNESGVVDFQLAAQQMNANIKVDSFKRSIWVIETKIKKKQDDAGGFEEFVKSLPAPEEGKAKGGKGGGSRKRKAAAAVVDEEEGKGEESVPASPKKKKARTNTNGKGKANGTGKGKKGKGSVNDHEDADAEGEGAEEEEVVAEDGTRVKAENWDGGNGSEADAEGVSEGGDGADGLFR